MQIKVISHSVETKPGKKGSYQQLEVVYKNVTYQGKVESKKLMSFGAGKAAFDIISLSKEGDEFEVSVVKNDAGFNDWVAVVKASNPTTGESITHAAAKAKSSFEGPEERAQREIRIVRQSTLGYAVNLLSAGAKAPPKVEDVFATAQKLQDYVFGLPVAEPEESFGVE